MSVSSSASSNIQVIPETARTPASSPSASSSSDERSSDGSFVDSDHEDVSVRARIKGESLLIISGAGTFLKRLVDRPSISTGDGPADGAKPWTRDRTTTSDGIKRTTAVLGHVANERGLYPKSYVVQHPEINWVHRGQGMYLPESKLLDVKTVETPQKRRHSNEPVFDDRHDSRSSKRRRSNYALDVTSSWETRSSQASSRTQSPTSTRKHDPFPNYGLRQRPTEHEPSASELREARMRRRMNPAQSSSQPSLYAQHDEDSEANKTYLKAYVDAHPELKFKHCGNGFYKKELASQSSGSQTSRSSRRNSNQSIANSLLERENTSNQQRDYASGAKQLSQDSFHDRENGYHRRASSISQPTTTSSSNADDGLALSQTDTFSKAQMLQYKALHPDVVFAHRGNGRYKRVGDVAAENAKLASLAADDRTTYGKEYVALHPELEFYHCGGGRYKRGSRQTRAAGDSEDGDEQGPPVKLFDKQFVDDHPELVFYHRGQGRYALGSQSDASSTTLDQASKNEKDTLYDRAYVDNHPDDTFHHRGQGRWARGLPPPGSSSKMAIRGPGVKLVKTTSNSSSGSRRDSKPDPNGLYRRDEGPSKWPELEWTYRGGGKWRISTKQEAAARAAKKSQAERRVESQADADMHSELESNASASRRGSIQGLDPNRPSMKRKRSALQSVELDDTLHRTRSRSLTPRQPLTLDQDILTDSDLPELFLDEWPEIGPDDTDDEAEQMLRSKFRPLNDPELFVRSMTKHDPSIRPTEVLFRLAEHAQDALRQMQDEYLELDRITAPHARIPRKNATGGRVPVNPLIFEDRKEADLYDYTFDPKKVGFQDPLAQRITVDTDGRGLRKRRRRNDIDTEAAAQLSEDLPLGRRVPKPVQRFDGNPAPQSRRPRSVLDARGSATPDPLVTPEKRAAQDPHAWADSYVAPASGRWANHVPKRIRELRGDSVGPARSSDGVGDADGSVAALEVDEDDDGTGTDGDSPRKRGGPRLLATGQAMPLSRVLHSIEDVTVPVLAIDVVD